ncbi:hypothetical protein Nepgr_006612 [Nepenthes gracilis]|uniref:Uncharacterized protein n=1 Tax=Nepenthes gracilis TaxID=150966 RepID=A0AAD3S639_NEPGR|nr:hypothetical protein Nepgr_006612 [Nepenthes gracilis]
MPPGPREGTFWWRKNYGLWPYVSAAMSNRGRRNDQVNNTIDREARYANLLDRMAEVIEALTPTTPPTPVTTPIPVHQ